MNELFAIAVIIAIIATIYAISTILSKKSKRALTVFLGVVCLILIAFILFPLFAQVKNGHGRSICLSSVKQLALSTIMYAEDYDQYTPLPGNWPEALKDYLKLNEDKTWKLSCDESEKLLPFAMNTYTTEINVATVREPEKAITIFESDVPPLSLVGTHKDVAYRHYERANFGFLDGHARAHKSQDLGTFKIRTQSKTLQDKEQL